MPNKKLKVHELALSLGISPGAVREALFRLVSEHLVETRDQRGFAVTPVSITDLQELTDLRCDIESIACRRSEEHTSELQSLMRISYAVFCLKKKQKKIQVVYT